MKRSVTVVMAALTVLPTLPGCTLPTSPEEAFAHPNEILIEEYTLCYGDYLGLGRISVRFSEKARMVRCSYDGDVECPAAGWAFPTSHLVTYYGPWVRDECPRDICPIPTTPEQLNEAAAHETCHLAGNWSEASAISCLHKVLEDRRCL